VKAIINTWKPSYTAPSMIRKDWMKVFKVRKGQNKTKRELRIMDVRSTFTQKGSTTLKYMYRMRDAVNENLKEINKDIKLAEKALR